MKTALYAALIAALVAVISIGCSKSPTESDSGSADADVVGTWAITDSSGTPGLTYVFNNDDTVTGTAVDAMNAILGFFGAPALAYTYDAEAVYTDGLAAGTYVVVVDTLTITWTGNGNVERCVKQ